MKYSFVLIAAAVLLCIISYEVGCRLTALKFKPIAYAIGNVNGNCEAWTVSSPAPLYVMSVTTDPYWNGEGWVSRKEHK